MILMCRLPLVQRFEEFVFTTSLRQFLCFSSKIGFNDQNPHRSLVASPQKMPTLFPLWMEHGKDGSML